MAVLVPPEVVTVIGTLLILLAPRLGTLVLMDVALTTVGLPPAVPLKLTAAPFTKLVPVSVIVVPEAAEVGDMLVMVGTCAWAVPMVTDPLFTVGTKSLTLAVLSLRITSLSVKVAVPLAPLLACMWNTYTLPLPVGPR